MPSYKVLKDCTIFGEERKADSVITIDLESATPLVDGGFLEPAEEKAPEAGTGVAPENGEQPPAPPAEEPKPESSQEEEKPPVNESRTPGPVPEAKKPEEKKNWVGGHTI